MGDSYSLTRDGVSYRFPNFFHQTITHNGPALPVYYGNHARVTIQPGKNLFEFVGFRMEMKPSNVDGVYARTFRLFAGIRRFLFFKHDSAPYCFPDLFHPAIANNGPPLPVYYGNRACVTIEYSENFLEFVRFRMEMKPSNVDPVPCGLLIPMSIHNRPPLTKQTLNPRVTCS
jgi:hypothetical protein